MEIRKVGIVGAGQMGAGIAQVLAQSKIEAIVCDISQGALDKGKGSITSSCDRMIKKGTMTEADKQEILKRLTFTTQMKELSTCDLAIEAATENIDLKIDLFKKLDEILPQGAILCTNTSSISITRLAAVTRRPDKVTGMHFMNPVPLMKLVEGIRGLQTSNETFSAVRGLAEKLGKTFVESRDMPGFIVNRVLMPMLNEAAYALMEGIADAKGIDEAMKLGTNQPMGPLTLADFIGLDTVLAILNVLHEGLGDPKYRPCPLLIKYVEAGWLGKKTGRGFYNYA